MNPDEFTSQRAGRLIRVPGPAPYWAFMPNPLPPELHWDAQLASALAEAERALGELAQMVRDLPDPRILVGPFVRQEAVVSSGIEGTKATLSDLYVYEAQQLPLLELPSDVREVHNYVKALGYGLERLNTLPLSLRLIREVHARLMEGARGGRVTPGEFRRSQNWIGGTTPNDAAFVPPPPVQMGQTLNALEGFLHTYTGLPALIRIALVHYQFEAIHPFLDGNGRMGRLLIALLLVAWEVFPQPLPYVSAYFEGNRTAYYDGLMGVSQRGEWEFWLLFFLASVALQATAARTRAERLRGLREDYRGRLAAKRAPGLLAALDALLGQPVLTISDLAVGTGLTYQTARRHLQELERAGFVEEITGRRRSRLYAAREVIRIVEEPLTSPERGRLS